MSQVVGNLADFAPLILLVLLVFLVEFKFPAKDLLEVEVERGQEGGLRDANECEPETLPEKENNRDSPGPAIIHIFFDAFQRVAEWHDELTKDAVELADDVDDDVADVAIDHHLARLPADPWLAHEAESDDHGGDREAQIGQEYEKQRVAIQVLIPRESANQAD
jgi:hypothetical protein